ncbi:MAG TPA: alpha/beta fold hydrolase [Geobacteraceae bacterium]|nr:alpha/beta fold hydrolase [Geobacteraceae bacterium]
MGQLLPKESAGMVYTDGGQGLPLLFLHGWLMSRQVWTCQTQLAECFRVIAPDLRGHGETGGEEFSYASCVADLVAFIDHLGLGKVVVVGWSMGAQIALQLTSRLRDRVAGLVLVGGTPLFCKEEGYGHGVPQAEARSMALRLRRSFNRTAGEFYQGMFSPDDVMRTDISVMAKTVAGRLPRLPVALAALEELVRTDLRGLLADIPVPVLLIHGGADRICLPGASRFMHEVLPDSRLQLFSGTGHAPFLTMPAEFNSCLSAFAREVYDAD